MESQIVRITIEVPHGAEVRTPGSSSTTTGSSESAAGAAIDAGSPPMALLAALGDPDKPARVDADIVATGSTVSAASGGGPIDAGGFPAHIADEMDAMGPRHPAGQPGTSVIEALLSPESRN
jgi:hypothetical protein